MKSLIYLALVASLAIDIQAEFRMEISPAHAQVGDEVLLICHVIGESPRVAFEWYRMNSDGSHEVIAVNMVVTNTYLGERDPGRFIMNEHVEEEGDDATYTIKITAAQIEDNACYGCNVITLRDVTSHLDVIKIPEEIYMYGNESPMTQEQAASLEPYEYNELLHITEDSRGYFMCVANGFIPKPNLTMTFDGEELTQFRESFSENIEFSETNDEYNYKVHNAALTSTVRLEMQFEANRLPLTCTAEVPGHRVTTMVRPVLRVGPQINCTDTHVPSGARQVKLTCIVDADPEVEELEWSWTTIDGQTMKLAAGDTLDNKYSSHRDVMEDGLIETSMVFEKCLPQMFHNYRLDARNEVGNGFGTASLTRDLAAEREEQVGKPSGGSSNLFPTGAVLAVALIATWRLIL